MILLARASADERDTVEATWQEWQEQGDFWASADPQYARLCWAYALKLRGATASDAIVDEIRHSQARGD